MSSPAFRPVNLAGVRWYDGTGRVATFNAARPGYGVEDVATGELVSSDGVAPSAWARRSIAAQIAEFAAVGALRLVTVDPK